MEGEGFIRNVTLENPIAGIKDVPNVITSPLYGLYAIADVDLAYGVVVVPDSGHHAQAMQGKRWQVLREIFFLDPVVQLCGHISIHAIPSRPHVLCTPELSWL